MFRGIKAFKKTITDFAEEVPRGGVKAIREEARNWFAEVVDMTPVKTGFASSQWKASINKRPSGKADIKYPGGTNYAPASTPSFYNLGGKDTVYIYNKVEYINRLEDGYSRQAPKNFFKNSSKRAQRRLQNAFKRLVK